VSTKELTREDITEPPVSVGTVEKFDAHSVTDADGWTMHCAAEGVPIAKGDLIEMWGKGLGFTVRGFAVGGHLFWYRTEAQQKAQDEADRLDRDAKRRAEFEAGREKADAAYDALPDTFKARIDRFRAGNPNFRWEFEGYEMASCTDALKIASYCSVNRIAEGDEEPTAADNVLAYQKLPHEEQLKAGISDGHSGNTFGFAVRLAYLWVTDPGRVEFEHGAMVPLVGCRAYGCTHEEAMADA
jgi:hypothetical protein